MKKLFTLFFTIILLNHKIIFCTKGNIKKPKRTACREYTSLNPNKKTTIRNRYFLLYGIETCLKKQNLIEKSIRTLEALCYYNKRFMCTALCKIMSKVNQIAKDIAMPTKELRSFILK